MSETLTKPAAAKPAVSHDEFLHHMDAMRTHYTAAGAGKKTLYAMPTHLLHPVGLDGSMAVAAKPNADVTAALQAGKAKTLAFATHQKDSVSNAMNKLQADHNTASFADQMKALEGQAQQQAHDTIHQQFESLIDIGTKHPEQQHQILSLTNQIGAFFTNLIASVGAFFKDVVNKIMGWIKSAVDWVKGAAATVANWAAGAVSTIGHFFSSLF